AGLYASLMMLGLSKPIGELIPRIEIGVFAWRMMTVTSLSLAMLSGSLAQTITEPRESGGHLPYRRLALGFLLAAVGTVSFVYVVHPMYRAEAFEPNPEHSNYSLAPVAAGREAPWVPEVILEPAAGRFSIETWNPEYRVMRMEMARGSGVGFRTFNFPGWVATSDGVSIPVSTGKLGEMTLDLPPGIHQIVLEFQQTRVRSLGVLLSAFAIVVTALLWLIDRRLFRGQLPIPQSS
ncbi:MAG: hypothetical protein ABI882_18690, partial [Acidobacteriota bacterium]